MYEWSLVAECDAVLEICDSNRVSGKKRIITRMLLLQATVKRFQFDLYINLEGQQMLISSWGQKKSLRTDKVNQTAQSMVKSSNFMFLGHNVLIYCS